MGGFCGCADWRARSKQVMFLVQKRDARSQWRAVTTATTRPAADKLASELRQALIASRYTPAAAVRVATDADPARETNSRS